MHDAYAFPPREIYDHSPPGKPSEFLHHLPALLTPGEVLLIVLYVRVSGRDQAREDGLKKRMKHLRATLQGLPVKIIAAFEEESSGWKENRPQLARAIAHAERHGAVVVAHSTDRFIRNQDYAGDRSCVPTEREFQQLMKEAGGVKLATVLEPDAPEDVIHSEQVKRNPNNGRPAKRTQGDWLEDCPPDLASKVMWMRILGIETGVMSVREGAAHCGLPKTTFERLVKMLPGPWRKYWRRCVGKRGT